jgi:tellurium resistance protein TerD
MAINLTKGQRVDVTLKKICVGLGWDPATGGMDFDLDASAFMIGSNGKCLSEDFFVYFNNPKSKDGAVESSGDDRTGGSSDGDDETLSVEIDKIDSRVEQILFVVTIYDYENRKQNFGQVKNSFIRIYNTLNNEELCRYDLEEDFSVESAIEFGRLYRRGGEWRFEAMGNGYRGGLEALVTKYI